MCRLCDAWGVIRSAAALLAIASQAVLVGRATQVASEHGSVAGAVSEQEVGHVESPLLVQICSVLDQCYRRPPNSLDDSPWKLLHWSIAYGIDAQLRIGGPRGQEVSSIGWLCENRPGAGLRLMSQSGDGMQLPIAAGKQGHAGQFLAMLAQAGVQPEFGIQINDRRWTVDDLVQHERATCRSGQELTFKLIGISHYGGTDDAWTNNRGESWSVRRLLEEELRQPISHTSTCGGTHRLFAWSYAVQRRRSEELPIKGPWELAARRTAEYQARALRMQNRDGSFSTAWLERSASDTNPARRLTTSGHVAEWLAYSLSDAELHDPRFERALAYLTGLLEQHRPTSTTWGATCHALHALVIYERRMSGSRPGERRKSWIEEKSAMDQACKQWSTRIAGDAWRCRPDTLVEPPMLRVADESGIAWRAA